MRVAFKRAVEISKTGRNILIYPTGTRIADKQDKLLHGVSVLYRLINRPVVPVLLNSGKCWPYGSWLKHPGVITVRFLEVIPAGMSRQDFLVRLSEDLRQRI